MQLIIFAIFGVVLFGSQIKKRKENKMEYYNYIFATIFFIILLFCKITGNRSNIIKLMFIVVSILIIFTYIGSKLKRYKQ